MSDFMKKKTYIYLFLSILGIFFFSLLFEMGIFYAAYRYVFSENYRQEIMNIYPYSHLKNIFLLMRDWWINFEWKFDYIMIWSTNIFQLIFPLFSVVGSILYFVQKREENIKLIFSFSLKVSLSIFSAYLVFFSFIFFITNGNYTNYITRTLFLDLFGQDFYKYHIYLYYLINGGICFLFIPFIYIASGVLVSSLFKNKIQVYYYFIILYLFLVVNVGNLIDLFGDQFLYLDPSSILLAGSYESVSTPLLLFLNLIILNSSVYFYRKRRKCLWEKIYMSFYLHC